MKFKTNIKLNNKSVVMLVAVLLCLSAIVNTALITQLYKQNNKQSIQNQTENNHYIGYLIIKADENVNHPMAMDPTTGNLYIPELKLEMPALNENENLGSLVYSSYFISTENSELQIASTSDINLAASPVQNAMSDLNALMNGVPKLQACTRGIQIYFSNQSGQTLAYKKTLNDGRTLYFYTNSGCIDNNLLRFTEQINSY